MNDNFIGKSLKKIRKNIGLTQSEMILHGKIISVSQYSKIENGIHDIDASTLFEILAAHSEIDGNNLIEKIQSYYFEKYNKHESKISSAEYLSYRLMLAFYNNDLDNAIKIKRKIDSMQTSKELKLRAIITVAVLNHTLDKLDDKTKEEISYNAFKNDSWTENRDSLRLFSNAMSIIDPAILPDLMDSVLRTYKNINAFSIKIQERISSICINYLYVSKKNLKDINLNNIYKVTTYLEKIDEVPSLMFNKILGHYFYSWFNKDYKEVQNIKKILKLSCCDNFLLKL